MLARSKKWQPFRPTLDQTPITSGPSALSEFTASLPEDRFPPPFGHKHDMVLAVPFGMGQALVKL